MFEKLSLRDVLTLRLVCRWVGFTASSVSNRFISYPIPTHPPLVRESEIRLHATTLLSEPVVGVRRFTLSGEYDRSNFPQRFILEHQMPYLAEELLSATNLQHLRVRTVWHVALPILQKLARWPKLHRLDVPVRSQSSYLEASQVRHLTLRLSAHRGDLDTIPPLLRLTHLKIDCDWPDAWLDEPANTRLNFSQYPRLKWFKLCGNAPPQFLDTFKGQTTSLKRCIIGDHYDLLSGNQLQFPGVSAHIFFSHFAENLEAMIIHSGCFEAPISTDFPKLHSLKVTARTSTPDIIITDCPQLVQLSIISRETGSINNWLTELAPLYHLTLQNLQLIQNPIFVRSHLIWFEELDNETVGALAFCENLKFLEISGFLHMTEQGSRVLGKGHPELEAVMLNCTGMCKREREVCVRPRDLRISQSSTNIKHRTF